MRRQREEFRKEIVSLIFVDEHEDENKNTFPNRQEIQLLKYYQYIAHGIDACHIAPISKKLLNRYV